jgi:hypothetical protein
MCIKHVCSVAWNGLVRLDVAAALVAAVLLVAALGSCFPALTPELAAGAGLGIVIFTFVGVPWLVRTVRLDSLHGF